MKNKLDTKIKCNDGVELSATLYYPKKIKGAVMIAPATGIKRSFYISFAEYLAGNGFGVLTFDNRGIGESIGESLNSCNASLVNWGKLDMSAVLEELKSVFPKTDYHLIGHSAGGQLAGLMDNATELKSMLNFASSSGSIKYSKYPFKFKSLFFLNVFIPSSIFLFGHVKSQWLAMGEPLPKLVARQWQRWCNGTGYVNVDLNSTIKKHLYDDLTFNSLWIHASDDEIANTNNVKDMISVYSKIIFKIKCIDPMDYGFKKIGHMSFFSAKKKALWSLALNWLNCN